MASVSNLYVSSNHIRRGGWRNWDDDAALGGQITMLKDHADLLSIFIGIFLVFVAAGLWTLLAWFIFHWNRRSRRKRRTQSRVFDSMYHQHQTILRNGSSDIAIGLAFLKTWMTWGRRDPVVVMRTLPIVILAFLSFGFFLIALPFITALELLDKQGNEVLIQSPSCGFWLADMEANESAAYVALMNQSLEATSYVDSCYESSAKSALCDQFLAKRRLPMITLPDVKCPFDESICLSTHQGNKHPAITIQTGVLDSHKHFGINAPPDSRIKLRRTTTCSPLDVSKFSKTTEGFFPNEEITGIYFGPTAGTNYTYGASNFQSAADSSYGLQVFNSRIANGTAYSQRFEPVPELHRDDADISIVFLNNNLIPITGINGPCKDPFFSATKNQLKLFPGYYWPDNPVTAIGCIDQYEFGEPMSDEWTLPMSYADATANNTFIKRLSKRQFAAFASFNWALGLGGGIDSVEILGTEALRAKKYPGSPNGRQNALPNDQWKREAEYWFMIGLAKIQLATVNIALGPSDPTAPGIKDVTSYIAAGRDDLMDLVCSTQKIHNLEFKNLHRTGLIVLSVLGSLLIIVPPLIKRFVIWRWRRREDVVAWAAYGQLQLQRMAAEGTGVRGWRQCNADVPLLDPHTLSSGDVDTRNLGSDGHPHPIWIGPDLGAIVKSAPRYS